MSSNTQEILTRMKNEATNAQTETVEKATVEVTQVVRGGKRLLEILKDRISSALFSLDKEQFIGHELITKLSDSDRVVLRNLINAFLGESFLFLALHGIEIIEEARCCKAEGGTGFARGPDVDQSMEDVFSLLETELVSWRAGTARLSSAETAAVVANDGLNG